MPTSVTATDGGGGGLDWRVACGATGQSGRGAGAATEQGQQQHRG